MKQKVLIFSLIMFFSFLLYFLSGCKKDDEEEVIKPLAINIVSPEHGDVFTMGDTIRVQIDFSGTEGPYQQRSLFIDGWSRPLSDSEPYYYDWNTFYDDTGSHRIYVEYYDPENIEGGVSDVCKISIVKGNFPYAAFGAENISGEAPLTVGFTDSSDNSPTYWHWDFGDGNTSDLQNPSHTYTEIGSYTITFTAGNALGHTTRENINYINVIELNACPGTPTITYKGQTYNTIQIGDQCWMRENLNWDTGYNACYFGDTANCEIYGRLYNWYTIMNGEVASNAVPSGVQGICMNGWHIPSNAEWEILRDELGGIMVAGGKMKEAGNKYWQQPNEGATNESGFTALPAGLGGGTYLWLGMHTGLLSTTRPNENGFYFWTLSSGGPAFSKEANYVGTYYSLRCLKD